MKRTVLLALSGALMSSSVFSQRNYYYNDEYYDTPLVWEVGISAGGMNCSTDVGVQSGSLARSRDWGRTTRLTYGFYGGFLYNDVFGARLEFAEGIVTQGDHNSDHENRNLSFRSSISEVALILELHPILLFNPDIIPRLSPYVEAGIGVFGFNPKTNYNGTWIALQPLHTEGQGFAEYNHPPYNLTQFNIPLGLGLKYELNADFTLRCEVLYRKLFTDYLDDVSTTYIDPALFQKYLSKNNASLATLLADRTAERFPGKSNSDGAVRGDPNNKDAYFSFSLKLGVTLGRQRR